MVPAGVFRLKDDASADAMPVHNPSGLWQAWKASDGRFLVQPLDQDEKPWGTTHMLDARKFEATLAPGRSSGEGADEAANPGSAAEADILALWYEQALAEQEGRSADPPAATVPGGALQDDPHAGWRAPSPGKGRLPSDEAILEPSWDPDEFFLNDEKIAQDHARPAVADQPRAAAQARPAENAQARSVETKVPRSAGTAPSSSEGAGKPSVPPPAREPRAPGQEPARAESPARSAGAGRVPAQRDPGPTCSESPPDDELFSDVFAQDPLSPGSPLAFMPSLSLEIESGPAPRPAPGSEAAPRPAAPVSDPALRPAAAAAVQTADKDRPSRLAAPAATVKGAEGGAADDLEFQDDDAYADARAQRLEQQMREEFALLLERFDKEPGPDVERDLSRLILRGAGFSWKQKFMFTEFGFALRRRRLCKLALGCHIRALSFSPKDEHVLFNVARSEYELGKMEEARVYLVKALDAAPDFDAAKRFLAFLDGCAPGKL